MINRRTFLRSGLAAAGVGLKDRRSLAAPGSCPPGEALPLWQSRPVAQLPMHLGPSVGVGGLPFAPWYTGDSFPNNGIPFHNPENLFPGGGPPAPTEEVDVAIVGGGISGLATALLLKRYRPAVFELRPRFGGNSVAEEWAGTPYSLGGAYFITPDEDSFLERFYRRLGLDRVARVDTGDSAVEMNGQLVPGFWDGAGRPPEEVQAFDRYREIVRYFAEDAYPDIPLPEGEDNTWIRDLDRRTLHNDIIERMNGLPIPPLLAAAIQGYCYSSFGASWDDISAAAGWNFIAAEEYGRWVLPGGNSYLVDAMWRQLAKLERGGGCPPRILRAGSKVVDVRILPSRRVQVTYADGQGAFKSLVARRVVLASSKNIAARLIYGLESADPVKRGALYSIVTMAYLVANILIDAPLRSDEYDTFFLRDGHFPMHEHEVQADPHFTDLVNGEFARRSGIPRTVLTAYWPLPWHTARFGLLEETGWQYFAEKAARDIRAALPLYGLSPDSVRQVRMTRWGHAMPLAAVGMIAEGTCEALRRPIEGLIYFVNQDNWALPAVETCLLEAEHWAGIIARDLG